MNTHFNYAARYFLTKSNLEYLAIEISKSAFSSCDNEVLENIDIHKNILVDPYTGGSLNILKLNDKCVIYSFGIDRDDDNANSFDEANLFYHPRSELWTIMTVPKWLYSESFIEEKLSGDIVVLVNSK